MRKLFLIISVFAVLGSWSVTAQEVPWTDKIFGNIEDAERIVFAVDTSGSIRDAGRLPLEKTLVIEIVGMLIDSGRNPMVEVITFDSDISVIVELAALNAVKDNIIPAINGIQDTDNLTWMNGAIDHACSITKPVHPNGALVLLTDGKPTTAERNGSKNIRAAGTATEVAAEKFRNECSTLTIIGIDVSGEAEEFLKGIASPGAYVTVKTPQTFFRPAGAKEAEVVVPQVKACEGELDINVDVEMVPWEDAYEKLFLNVAAGNAPDIGYIPSSWIPELAEAGYIIPITVPGERITKYFGPAWSTVTWKGDIYGIPRALFNHALYYNTELFEEAGIAGPPTTWEELVEAAAAITERTGAYGFALTGRRSPFNVVQFLNFLFQNGGGAYDEKGDIIINNANGVEALEFYVSLMYYTPSEALGMTESDLGELFARGEVGMFVSGPRWMDGWEEAGTPFKTASLPAGPNGWSTGVLSSHSLVVFSQSEHQEEARELALCLTKYEHQAELDTKLRMVPMRREEAEEIDLFQTDHWKGFISMIPKGTPLPLVTGWGKFEDVVAIAIEYAAAGMMTPEEALNQAANKLEEEGIEGYSPPL